MIDINYEHCTGCGACVQICPKNCIEWEEKEFGFNYPKIDTEKCIDCGICEKVCPIAKEKIKPSEQCVYAVVNREQDTLMESTSGGAFSALAKYVLGKNGVIYGCEMDENYVVKHIRVTKFSKMPKLRGSKYVQSNTGITFKEVEQDLKQGKLVLYSGTPCQISGLKYFLRKKYENLITVDIVCHGVGSQAYFSKFMDNLCQRKGKVLWLNFRDKKFAGWSCGGGGGGSITHKNVYREWKFLEYQNYYYHYFLTGDIYRKSCYSCAYSNIDRQGDFTIGDFWGVETLGLKLNTTLGCSVVIANNNKAAKLINSLNNVDKVEVKMEQADKHNAQLIHPAILTETLRNKLAHQYEVMSANEIQKVYLKENKWCVLKGKLKNTIPYKIKLLLRKLKK